MFVPGATARFLSEVITRSRPAFSVGVRASVVVPTSTAGTMSGSAALSSAVAGVSAFPKVVRSTRNGCCTFNDAVATANVDGDRAIVCS